MTEEENISTIITIQEPIIQITENGVEGFEILCRLCANRSDHLIPIYSEEGVTNDLADKMNLYLPVKVSRDDVLPLQCCFQCASTVLTWHELVVASVEADRRLRDVQSEVEKQIAQHNLQVEEPGPSQIEEVDERYKSFLLGEVSAKERQDKLCQFVLTLLGGNFPKNMKTDSLSPIRQDAPIEPELKSEVKPEVIETPSTTKKRRNIRKEDIKLETTDGEWIKTEFVLDNDVNSFINCDLGEDNDDPLEVRENLDTDSDFEPEYDQPTENHKLHTCPTCGKYFRKVSNMKRHYLSCFIGEPPKGVKKREYRCDFCQVVFYKKDDLKNHIQADHPEHYAAFTEKKIKQRSKIDQDAVNRAKIVVDSRTYYHCNLCGKNLHSPYTYIWHVRIHTGERPYICDLCGKQFRVSQGLVRHLRETHAGIKNFPCDICSRMFATRRNVEEHRRIHTNERPYICDLCGKSFKQKASLFVHNRSHNDIFPFKCSYCNQGFRTRAPLLVHITKHTGEKPFACDICGRCFRIKYELKRHMLIHSDDKPFSCEECAVSFRQKRYLRNHNKINHNINTP